MTTITEYTVHSKAGLTMAGFNEEGDVLWIGTLQQWKKVDELEELEVYRDSFDPNVYIL